MTSEHLAPWECVFAKENDSRCNPGRRPASDQEHFEVLCLCLLQAGLNWNSIRKNWQKYRRGFYNFDIDRLAAARPEELLAGPDVLRNARKVEAIIYNAKEFQAAAREHGSFADYLQSLAALPEQERLKSLTKRFKQVGPETADYFLHSVGRA